MKNACNNIQRFFYFLLSVAAVVAMLIMLNWLPLILQQDTLRKYASVNEVRSKLNFESIYVPVYFPENITWPPSEILAQNKPFPAILLVFHRAGRKDVELVISQAVDALFAVDTFIVMDKIRETVPFKLKTRPALLEVGTCKKNEPCSRITWSEGINHIQLVMKSSPFELIRIAESMIH